jgi:transposase
MRLHGHAKTCPHSRRLLVERLEGGWTRTEAAHAAGVSARTASKWLARWRSEVEMSELD